MEFANSNTLDESSSQHERILHNMENTAYLKSIGVTTPDTLQKCLDVMRIYGENHWWEPDVDPRKFAFYQILEPIMLCGNFSQLHESAELLLGRPIYTHEFGVNTEGLKQEAERAWKYQVGVTSDKERQERVQDAISQLVDYAEKNNKPFIQIDAKKIYVENSETKRFTLMSNIDFSHINQEQRQKLLKHLEDFKNDPQLMEVVDENELEKILGAISTGGSISDNHLLAVCIANTYDGDDGPAWFEYLRSLGLPQDIE